MKHGSLFSGIGGFDLAAQWMGWENIFHCEWNEFNQKILKYYWPNATSYGDISKADFTKYAGAIDVLTGGFPCQPFSTAGQRKGTADDRYLWPEMLRAIREIQPRWIVGENVRGLVNWSRGLVFQQVQADLENEGYEQIPFILPACAVNAPHRRDRIWFIAHRVGIDIQQEGRLQVANNDKRPACEHEQERGTVWHQFEPVGESGVIANACSGRQQGPRRSLNTGDTKTYEDWKASWVNDDGGWPTQSPVRNGDDGIPAGLDTDTISESEWRMCSLVAAGNAIVPQVALELFKAISQYEQLSGL